MINTITRINVDAIDWEDAPAGFDQSGTLMTIRLAEVDGTQLILGHDIDTHKSSIAADLDDE